MKLGILKTGGPPPAAARFGTYPEMFRRLLGEAGFAYRTYAADEGELPADAGECAAYLITGSAAAAYEASPWIDELKGFLKAAKGRARLVGVCFGHQVMAEAFGGRVIKSPKGWGVGVHTYEVLKPQPWMDGASPIRLPASHQDQVVEAPPGAEVIAASVFTPIGALAYRDQPAVSLQLHPEFEPDYAVALLKSRRGGALTADQADRAIETYQAGDDRTRVGGWIRNFLLGGTS